MTDQEMASVLKAKGWKVEEPWTKENCKHPPLARIGSGSLGCDGSITMSWHCRLCGKSETISTPVNPQHLHNQLQSWYA